MKGSTMSSRGFTLVELMTSTAIMIVAIAATCMVLIEGQRFTRNTEEVVNGNDNARIAGEFIANALRIAGMGGAAGLWINNSGTPRLISPIFGTDNIAAEGSTDDIWMILPDRRAFQENNCVNKSGGAVSLPAAGAGPPTLSSPPGPFPSRSPTTPAPPAEPFLKPMPPVHPPPSPTPPPRPTHPV